MEFELLIKKLKNKLSEEEKLIFDRWYEESEKHRNYFEKVSRSYSKPNAPINTDKAWERLQPNLKRNSKKQGWKIAAAAVIIAAVGLTSLLRLINDPSPDPIQRQITASPEKTEAENVVLTIGDGTDIVLTNKSYNNNNLHSNGDQIIYDSDKVQKSEESIEYNYLTVPRGQEFFVQLSDGTKVWVNSASKLKYPVSFTGDSRMVELIYGEAYFEVSPSSMHEGANFIVKTKNQVVEVLGTKFNIAAYRENHYISTTLVEGKVSLTNRETQQQEFITPNQQLNLNLRTNNIVIQKVDPRNIICWKNGFFRFKETTLADIMQVLSRWYDIRVTFQDENLKTTNFNGVFKREQSLKSILETIEKTGEATFSKTGDSIIISDNSDN